MKKLFSNPDFALDEIVFQSRNKAYGAYALRSESSQILTKSVVYGVLLFASAAVLPFIFKGADASVKKIISDNGARKMVIVENNERKIIPPKAIEIIKQKTFTAAVPEPKRVVAIEKPAPKISTYNTAIPSTVDTKGPETTTQYVPKVPTAIVPEPKITAPQPKTDNDIAESVDQEAVFPGGINNFRTKFSDGFDTASFDGGGDVMKCTIVFVVEKDGTISNVKVSGINADFNAAAAETLMKIKGKWQPAKIKGEPVRNYFKFPVAMQLQ